MRRIALTWRALLLIAVSVGIARADDPRPLPLARYFPKRDLVAYVEFDGIDAHAGAWKKTAASKILEETATGSMLAKVATQILEAALPPQAPARLKATDFQVDPQIRDAALPPGKEGLPTADEIATIVRQLVRSGFAMAINRKADDPTARPSCIGLVIRGGGKGAILPTLKKVLAANGLELAQMMTLDKPGGRKLTIFGPVKGPCVCWWVEKDDLVVSLLEADYSDTMIATLDGKEPNAVDHPIRQELAATRDGFEPVGLAFLDTTALPEMPAEAAMFGLDGIKRLDLQWGYQGEALASVCRIIAPSPRRGVLAMFDQPTFDAKSLPPLPDGVGAFTAISLDLVKIHDQLAALARAAEPKGPDVFAQAAEAFQKSTGRRLRDDFLASIGPKMVFADVPTRVFVSSNPLDTFAQSLARVPRFSLLIELNDRANFLKDLEALATWANKQLPIPKDPKAPADRRSANLVRRLKIAEVGYELALSPTYWPLPAGYRPSIVVGERFAAIGTSPDVARQALKRNVEIGAPLARALVNLPSDMTILSVVDTKNSALPEILANVPSMIQWWRFMLQGDIANTVLNTIIGFEQRLPSPSASPSVSVGPGRGSGATNGVLTPSAPDQVSGPEAVLAPSQPAVIPSQIQIPQSPTVDVPPGPDSANPIPNFRLRLDPDEIPTPEEIRGYLFPATYTMSADSQGFKITTREAFPWWNPIGLAPLGVSMALPAFQDWRETRERERGSANLKQIGLALGSYFEKTGRFPSASTLDKEGKPLLSWRVELLPYLGFQGLYDEFHRDEPWDSPHNKTLLDRMPTAFAHPDAEPGPGLTFYRSSSGKGAFFDPEFKEGITLAAITDGTSNTVAVVEAKEAVPWTKPGTELAIDQPNLISLLGGPKPGGFQALFIDGSVRFVREALAPVLLRALFTRDGGEVISADAF